MSPWEVYLPVRSSKVETSTPVENSSRMAVGNTCASPSEGQVRTVAAGMAFSPGIVVKFHM